MTAAPTTSTPAAEGEAPRASSRHRVVGVDPSLTSTGLATSSGTLAIVPKTIAHRTPAQSLERIRSIAAAVLTYTAAAGAELVVIEGYIPGKAQAGVHERGGLWWRVVDLLFDAGYPVASIKPAGVKLYATGKGNAGKPDVVLAAARRFAWYEGRTDDEADALWLAAIGAELLGHPIADMPARNREALLAVEWIGGRP